ncbi:serine-protein kinase ATR family protein [Acanthamoeba castellanii str. Neff]|uniref:Serine-protein kinase ATR family protein n=1 Tax=Acanthamoeba castellanii (strain ATCC 30010 / Neff) TaxID=1257118 RepID=L8HHX5_ACACF|nr:serine-protein kinase ATR family protein [Acanthamoeba castellanii str. Neff]ELR24308.1 serine-protein kinase ATR family protein [Acanthamoeba castellanii str. Neff]
MVGSDGQEYLFLCKPKDDLRKDCRMMEFNTMINKLLKKHPETRRRKLRIRTYAVVPLNEECGLIEWVPNTTGFRHILTAIYNAEGLGLATKQLRDVWGSKMPAVEIYRDHVLPFYPPVFHKWFLKSFPDPTTWFEARLAYARAIAVMSMVGYLVGLGDRHGENILFDSTTGECVHVDFNCLFWRGLTFEKPEKVPFRLTPNMTDALGLTKHEGVYRSVCELTLRVLRDNKDTLMSVLETFIYDPLVEWTAKGHRSTSAATGETNNESAVQTVADIERRLKGQEKSYVTLSVEGQVHTQINEAISQDNLSRMYIGWAPWM